MAEVRRVKLSPREKQLIKFAADGLTDTAIANRLEISEATVSTYWRRIRAKVGPYSRTELVASLLKNESERIIGALLAEQKKLMAELSKMPERDPANFYRQIVQDAADAILLVDPSGRIEMINAAGADLFGYTQAELQGKHISVLVPERLRGVHSTHVSKYVTDPDKRKMGDHLNTPALHRSGEEFMIAANLSAVSKGKDRAFMCMIRKT
ncbi:MAG: hypothetical protein HONBIEJF_02631 [Fimbriimonadaceae bacterium]|nr:hypothetical protein [Fimbriimonadaceae bacterium]